MSTTNLAFQLLAASNYIDALGGVSQSYRQALASYEAKPAHAVEPVACIQHFNGDKGRLFFIEDVDPPPGSDSYIDAVTWTLLYAAPAAPTPAWVEVTPALLAEQHPWLYSPVWVALKSGRVCMATYEWRQGRNPDRLVGPDIGDEWAFNATHVMPVNPPAAPAIEASKGESNG